MKFRNPWIDPRVLQVHPQAVQQYLTQNGWRLDGPAANPLLLRYERMEGAEQAPTLFVPTEVDEGPRLAWLIELIGDLARFEDRWAVDVLNDILRHSDGVPSPNGPNLASQAAPAPK